MQLTDKFGRWLWVNHAVTACTPDPHQVIESQVNDGRICEKHPGGRIHYVRTFRLYREWLQGNLNYGK